MSGGQARKDPFHVNRDVVRDNKSITRKLRLPRGAQIRVQSMFATAVGNSSLDMPFAGNLNLTVTSGAVGNTIVINNPFITSASFSPVVLSIQPAGAVSTIAVTGPGLATITLGGTVVGTYVVSVGARNDRRVNAPFAQ